MLVIEDELESKWTDREMSGSSLYERTVRIVDKGKRSVHDCVENS